MITVIIKNSWFPKPEGIQLDYGWGNGYVIIPKGHPLHGVPYDDIDVEVHGGLTYGNYVENVGDSSPMKEQLDNIPEEYKDGWMVGFDTFHYDDTAAYWTKERVQEEVDRLLENLKQKS